MVFSTLISSALHRFCDRWVKDYKKENLKINALSGTIEMNDFELALDEIHALQLPIEVKKIRVGNVLVNIPYAQLTSRPVEIEIKDVMLLSGTPTDLTFDHKSLFISEQSTIFFLEQILRDSLKSSRGKKSKKKPSPMLLAIIRNLSVKLHQVHFRFEDGVSGLTSTEHPCQFAFGLCLSQAIVEPAMTFIPPIHSTVEGRSTNEISEAYRKKITLLGFGIYFCEDEMMSTSPPSSQHKSSYVLDPTDISIDIKLLISKQSYPQPETLDFQISATDLNVNLSMEHARYVICMLEGIEKLDRLLLYRRFRPSTSTITSKNAKQWWRYAINCTLMDLHDPHNGKASWKKTLNLMLVGFQYSVIRRKIKPYLVRNSFVKHNETFLHYRESFRGLSEDDVEVLSQEAVLERGGQGHNVEILPQVYGVMRTRMTDRLKAILTRNQKEEEKEAKELYLRMLAIEASFRPAIIAKLRVLTDQQLAVREKQAAHSKHAHNAIPGILTLSIGSLFEMPRGLSPFVKVRVGSRGKNYKGDVGVVDASTSSTLKTYHIFQTFEFHVQGSLKEDFITIELYDRWPVMDHHVGTLAVDLPALIKSDVHEEGVVTFDAIEVQHKNNISGGCTTISKMSYASLFVASKDHERSTCRTSKDVLKSSTTFDDELHKFYSRYGPEPDQVTTSRVHSMFLIENISLKFRDSEESRLFRAKISNFRKGFNRMFNAGYCKSTMSIKSLLIFHKKSDAEHLLVEAPSVSKDFINNKETQSMHDGNDVVSEALMGGINVTVDLLSLTSLVHQISYGIPEAEKRYSLLESPFYKGMIKVQSSKNRHAALEFISSLTCKTLSLISHSICFSVLDPRSSNESLLCQVTVPPSSLRVTVESHSIAIENIDTELNLLRIPMSGSEVAESIEEIQDLLKEQWCEEQGSFTKNIGHQNALSIRQTFAKLDAKIGTERTKLRNVLSNPAEFNIVDPSDCLLLEKLAQEQHLAFAKNQSSPYSLIKHILQQGISVIRPCHHRSAGWSVLWCKDNSVYTVSSEREKLDDNAITFYQRDISNVRAIPESPPTNVKSSKCILFIELATGEESSVSLEFESTDICRAIEGYMMMTLKTLPP